MRESFFAPRIASQLHILHLLLQMLFSTRALGISSQYFPANAQRRACAVLSLAPHSSRFAASNACKNCCLDSKITWLGSRLDAKGACAAGLVGAWLYQASALLSASTFPSVSASLLAFQWLSSPAISISMLTRSKPAVCTSRVACGGHVMRVHQLCVCWAASANMHIFAAAGTPSLLRTLPSRHSRSWRRRRRPSKCTPIQL